MTFGVVSVERLFDPGQIERLDQFAEALRGDTIPLLVSVYHQIDASINQLVDGLHARQIDHRIGLADLDLDAADAFRQQGLDIGQHLRQRRRQKAPRGVVALH